MSRNVKYYSARVDKLDRLYIVDFIQVNGGPWEAYTLRVKVNGMYGREHYRFIWERYNDTPMSVATTNLFIRGANRLKLEKSQDGSEPQVTI